MESKILKYLSKYTSITKELENAVNESAFFKTYKKGTILLKEGSFSNECYFILDGCIRSYFLKDGEEKTIEFYTEEDVVTPANYGKSTPSRYYLECIEDTVVNVGNPTIENEMYQKYPQLESLSRVIAEVILTKQQESFTEFKTSTPEERYLNLLKTKPDLLQRVSQYQIASYLGITPESLSRIRKRIVYE
ncbi:Crp/Fnr family transcriptional regulator [Pseudotamlana agarivorans]|uniref:Crp/Fnr family transcriptional regulator n=1 Tax=Pseudotamlana agarivorans TaxID=481183 RepID=UPI000835B19D|nr:Crp/Fnr family transcriptional regulator [Tamlana agarivorans]